MPRTLLSRTRLEVVRSNAPNGPQPARCPMMRRPTAWRTDFSLVFLAASLPLCLSAQVQREPPRQPGQLATTKPLSVRDKFDYRVVQSFGFRGFLGAGFGAGIAQAEGRPKEWGGGATGFADRYASAFGTNLSRQAIAFGVESAMHEDPRYFPSEDKAFGARMKSVLIQTVTVRTDSGTRQIAYGRICGAFGAGELSNAWQPRSTASFGDGLQRGAIMLGGDAGYNFLQEFVPFLRPRTLRRHN
jgi:hypothetical protein